MSGINKVILVGNVGSIEQKGGVVRASLATSEKYRNKQGEQVEDTSWHRLVFFGRMAEVAGQYVGKGDQLYVEGSIKYGKYTDNEGIERYTTDINVRSMQMLGSRSAKKDGGRDSPPHAHTYNNNYASVEFDDELPF